MIGSHFGLSLNYVRSAEESTTREVPEDRVWRRSKRSSSSSRQWKRVQISQWRRTRPVSLFGGGIRVRVSQAWTTKSRTLGKSSISDAQLTDGLLARENESTLQSVSISRFQFPFNSWRTEAGGVGRRVVLQKNPVTSKIEHTRSLFWQNWQVR